ncbi:MAG TPA: LacI family DNA-binding transcriptional regulator [Terriglobia bacterium]|nr:LacI family DNA-binding transcriptional regulator [Terriglobia bacterium]
MVTIRDIAIRAGVSTATVSHVVNQNYPVSVQVRERVLRSIRDLNYHPNAMARGLRTSRSKTVGMVIPDITNPFFPAVVRAAEDVLNHAGYTLFVGNSDNALTKQESYYRAFREQRVDGLLLITSGSRSTPEYLSNHQSTGVPIVLIDRYYPGMDADAVLADNLRGSYEAVDHLLDHGHRRIGIITGPLQLINARLRLAGYKKALEARRVALKEDLVAEGRFDIESGYQQARNLLALSPRPTALFICNGLMTEGCLRAMSELRLVHKIALVSFDDLGWFPFAKPSVSAVAQPAYDLGAAAANILLKRISGKMTGPPRRRLLKTTLIVRDSSLGLHRR